MGQFSWKYIGNPAEPPKLVTLYHGERTGHVLITMNSQVIVIDFNIRDTKSYSFFIDEEFCVLEIIKEPTRFVYTFKIDENIQTPRNEKRKKRERSNIIKTAISFSILIFFACLMTCLHKKKKDFNPSFTSVYDRNSKAVIKNISSSGWISYSYKHNDEIFVDSIQGRAVYRSFPLEVGDEFRIRYATANPTKHLIKLQEPTAEQVNRYYQMAIDKEQSLHPTQSRARAECRLEIALLLFPNNAIATFYFQDRNPEKYADGFNANSYKRMVRSVKFKEKAKKCLSY